MVILNDSTCACLQHEETTIHALRECNLACSVWQQLLLNLEWDNLFSMHVKEWLAKNLAGTNGKGKHKFFVRLIGCFRIGETKPYFKITSTSLMTLLTLTTRESRSWGRLLSSKRMPHRLDLRGSSAWWDGVLLVEDGLRSTRLGPLRAQQGEHM